MPNTMKHRGLSKERIIAAALRFVDKYGAESLTMRKLGAELGVEAMALYRYFLNKESLLHGVLDDLLVSMVGSPQAKADWRSEVLRFSRSFRRLASEHPSFFSLLMTGHDPSPKVRAVFESSQTLWQSAGFNPELAAMAKAVVGGYVCGATMWETTVMSNPEMLDRMKRWNKLSKHEQKMTDKKQRERLFEFGLNLILDGLERELKTRALRLSLIKHS